MGNQFTSRLRKARLLLFLITDMKLKKWKVTYTAWRETWSGHDQCDGDREEIVKAKTKGSAISKVKKANFGGNYSHCIWGRNWEAFPM